MLLWPLCLTSGKVRHRDRELTSDGGKGKMQHPMWMGVGGMGIRVGASESEDNGVRSCEWTALVSEQQGGR